MPRRILILVGLLVTIGPLAAVFPALGGAALADSRCLPAGLSGLTTVMVARSGQTISGTINATGCDVGVYVGPWTTNVTITGATITGARAHAILVQDTRDVWISGNTVTNNEPGGELFAETKAIQLTGTSQVTVAHNLVTNNGGGGIAVVDDGPTASSTRVGGTPMPASTNTIANNIVVGNQNGCGIVVAAYNVGEGVNGNVVRGNTVRYNPAGIIVAADAPGTSADANAITDNVADHNGFASVIVHANTPGDRVTRTVVGGNTIGVDFSGIGLLVADEVGPAAVLDGTIVTNNTISNQAAPILHYGDTNTTWWNNSIV